MLSDVLLAFRTGGISLYLLFGLLWFAWTLALLEAYFLTGACKGLQSTLANEWRAVKESADRSSVVLSAVRSELLSRMRQALFGRLSYLRVVVVISPLCGLLGTVSGMIEVFEVVQVFGTGNVQALASGISQATFSTAAGIIVSLMALALFLYLSRTAEKRFQSFQKELEV